jgi:hypothetical protein
MPTILFRFLVFLVLITSTFVLTNAQDRQEPSGKTLEIQSTRTPPPGNIALFWERSNGFWAPGFPRLKDWKMPSTGDPVQALEFKARLVGDKCELTISQFSGKRFGANIDILARVVVVEGETFVVSELKKYGFEPVTVKMVTTPIAVGDVPIVSNPSPRLRTTVNSVVATLPAFSIKFQNDSPKDVMAIEWHTETSGRILLSSISQGKYGKALIEANGSFERIIRTQKRETDLNPVTMAIGAVIYRDGSIDGDPKAASSFLAFTEGRNMALDKIVPLFDKAIEIRAGLGDLASLISDVDSLNDGSPRVNGRPSTARGIAFNDVVTEAVGFLRRAEVDFAGKSDAEFAAALNDLAKFYREWQTRMKR